MKITEEARRLLIDKWLETHEVTVIADRYKFNSSVEHGQTDRYMKGK